MDWIPVTEKLPNRDLLVNVLFEDSREMQAYLIHNDWWAPEKGVIDWAGDPTPRKDNVSHWRSL